MLDSEQNKEDTVIELREDYTYGVEVSIDDESKIPNIVKDCKEIIDISKEIIYE